MAQGDKPSLLAALRGPGSPKPPVEEEEDLAPVSPEQIGTAEDLIQAIKRGDAESVAVLLQSALRG